MTRPRHAHRHRSGAMLLLALLAMVVAGIVGEGIGAGGSGAAGGTIPALSLPAGVTTRPASLVYGDPARATEYAAPGSLVVAGRTNYDDPAFQRVSDAGGSVLIYLDPMVTNAWGRYHTLLFDRSACGPATGDWPGSPHANQWGVLSDFRPGSVLQQKLHCVLETMVRENPRMAGWFADDVGSRSWFPGIDWSSWDTASQQAYRAGAIELTRTFRQVADEHRLIVMVNGTWSGGSLAEDGGGYPDAQQSGNALVDGAFVENHDGQSAYFERYACSPQWAAQSAVSQGRAVNFAITRTWTGLEEFASSKCFAFANAQPSYDFAPPWAVQQPPG